jgi:hypothetical protein
MVQFATVIKQFDKQGDKTGWTYILIPANIATALQPGNRKGFRVKGKLDNYVINSIALIPMGGGDFIMALNATIRKGIGKRKGDKLKVQLEIDETPQQISADLLECLSDEPEASEYFESLTKSHRMYFSNWIESAKTQPTKAKRIAHSINALTRKWDFGMMLRSLKKSE